MAFQASSSALTCGTERRGKGERLNALLSPTVVPSHPSYTYIMPAPSTGAGADSVLLVPNSTVWNSVIIAHDLHKHPEAAAADIVHRALPHAQADRSEAPSEPDRATRKDSDAAPAPSTEEQQQAQQDRPGTGIIEFEALRRAAWAELSALSETQLMRRHAAEVSRLDHDRRKICLWLADEPSLHAQRREWLDYVRAVGAVPAWVPIRIAYGLTRTEPEPLAHPATEPVDDLEQKLAQTEADARERKREKQEAKAAEKEAKEAAQGTAAAPKKE